MSRIEPIRRKFHLEVLSVDQVAEIQSAIAIIRKHAAGTKATIEQFVAGAADATVTSPAPARSAPRQQSIAAPVIPSEPATTSTRPNVPL